MPLFPGIFASAISGHLTPADAGSYFPISNFTLASAQANIDITNIPQTYKHLQLRVFGRTTRATNGDAILLEFNGDSNNNYYSTHYIYGNGTSAAAGADGVNSRSAVYRVGAANSATNIFGTIIIDILDYTSLNKNKTIRSLGGFENNSAGEVWLCSSLWFPNTIQAINRIKITPSTLTNFIAPTSAALYGVL